jgi:predicted membrane protein
MVLLMGILSRKEKLFNMKGYIFFFCVCFIFDGVKLGLHHNLIGIIFIFIFYFYFFKKKSKEEKRREEKSKERRRS